MSDDIIERLSDFWPDHPAERKLIADSMREIERQRAEIERLKQEPELLRAELISLANAARKALADAYNRARETRDAFIEWRDVR